MTNLTQESKCYSAGLKMLMRREHSRLELFQKLQTKGFDVDVVNDSISKLVEQNYQSDDRFSEEFCAASERRHMQELVEGHFDVPSTQR